MNVQEESNWLEGYLALEKRIQADEQFPALLRSVHTRPGGWIPSRRTARLATVICERLELDPAVYRGNVFGAAATYVLEHGSSS
jgi:hypothetical protein